MSEVENTGLIKSGSSVNKLLIHGNKFPSYSEKSFPELYYFEISRYLWYDKFRITYLDIKPEKWSNTVLFFHGNFADLGNYYNHLINYASKFHLRILALEYPGFGISSMYPSSENLIVDAAYFFLQFIERKLGVKYEDLIIMGHSLGTGVSIGVVYEQKTKFKRLPKQVVLIGGFTGLKKVLKELVGGFLVMWIAERFDNVGRLRELSGFPLLIIHGDKDETILVHHAHELYKAYNYTEKKLLILHGANHSFPDPDGDIMLAFAAFNVK